MARAMRMAASGGELAVGSEQDIGAGTDGFAHRLDHAGAEVNVRQQRLVPTLHAVRPGRIELDRSEALANRLYCSLCCQIRVVIDILRAICGQRIGAAAGRIEIGVGAKPLVHPAAKQLVHRLSGFLADDVPAGHFQRRTTGHHGHVGALRKAR